ncbi:hypothetical protein BDDG_04907 [Blastomyces dermatitidis ATCC 18188]|uniref:Uncharacterized protein n=1 Tax=Ajellomyces dermatitidis (strain ATCC 18188 / CBS 674.68) TaxID=653446 RepID=F2TFF1_AJEDA|nr:hypothetical protein BDDG_04907 [Blastomyces dermatitidis ATCC 18188]
MDHGSAPPARVEDRRGNEPLALPLTPASRPHRGTRSNSFLTYYILFRNIRRNFIMSYGMGRGVLNATSKTLCLRSINPPSLPRFEGREEVDVAQRWWTMALGFER